MSASSRQGARGEWAQAVGFGVVVGLALVALSSVWVGVNLGYRLAGLPAPAEHDVYALFLAVVTGRAPWPLASTIVAIVTAVLASTVVVLVFVLVRRLTTGSRRVDGAARHMGTGRDIEAVSRKAVARKAKRLGVEGTPGVMLGRAVAGSAPIMGSWEDVYVVIAGPRTGKTTCMVVPTILDAPGAVVTTSNKRDVVDATLGPRSERGRTWVFDPQCLAGHNAEDWWWNPLSYVTDSVQAAKLAEIFAVSGRDMHARTDAFFDNSAQTLLAGMLLAAACSQRPITDVHAWLTRPVKQEAADILRAAGQAQMADSVRAANLLNDETRAGVFATALQMVDCLTNQRIRPWIVQQNGTREHLSPALFAQSTDTLYSLSKEGRGSAGPLVTALTVAVMEAAEAHATASPGGRLSTPMLAVLDEAANVCRWRELPTLYSHYGSRGIIPITVLQSYSQGESAWGREGMAMMWSAANVKVYGGGVAEPRFLEDLSRVIGDFEAPTTSTSYGRGPQGRSTSTSTRTDRIMSVHDLAALPAGRAVVVASGSRPTLVRTVPWMDGPHAERIRRSIADARLVPAADPQED